MLLFSSISFFCVYFHKLQPSVKSVKSKRVEREKKEKGNNKTTQQHNKTTKQQKQIKKKSETAIRTKQNTKKKKKKKKGERRTWRPVLEVRGVLHPTVPDILQNLRGPKKFSIKSLFLGTIWFNMLASGIGVAVWIDLIFLA